MTNPSKVYKTSEAQLRANHKYYDDNRSFILQIQKNYYKSNKEEVKRKRRERYAEQKKKLSNSN